MQRLLIVKTSSLGDLFHALPAVHSIRRGWGTDVQIDWIVNTPYVPVVRCFGDVTGVIGFPRKGTSAAWRSFRRALREKRYDAVVDLQGLMKSALIARLALADRRIAPSFCREGSRAFYREIAVGQPACHAVDQCLDTVRFLGLEISPEPPPLHFPLYPLTQTAPILAVAPASRWPSKDWPPEHFITALNRLRETCQVSVVLVGGPAERAVCDRIAAGLTGQSALNLAGRTSLVEACSILRQADLLLSVDSGPVHIAAASGTRVLGLYGPTDPGRTGPYGPGHRVIRAPGTDGTEHRAFRRNTPETLSIMARIDPLEVARTMEEMLAAPAHVARS